MQIAIVGSGISGLSCGYRLAQAGHQVTLFESADYFGGHTHTVDVSLDGVCAGVDTGFLVFNHRTYPNLVALFKQLDIDTVATDMSFSVKLPLADRLLEWAGTHLDSVFAQRRNLIDRGFLRMLRDVIRFNHHATRLARLPSTFSALQSISLGEFLQQQGYSAEFRDWYLLPMAGCIWSCPTAQMLAFPVATFVRFCANHGLLQITNRPQWHTVKGGARQYVEKMLAAIPFKHLKTPVRASARIKSAGSDQIVVVTRHGQQHFDHLVLATHSDQSLRLLQDPSEAETAVLGAIRFQPNRAVLHTDHSCLPTNKKTWAAWNYQSRLGDHSQVCVHYLLNRLQPLPFKTPLLLSLNPIDEPAAQQVLGEFDYAHPVFDLAALHAQRRLDSIQGQRNTWFAGAWTGYGFHEDGLKSGLAAAQAILQAGRPATAFDASIEQVTQSMNRFAA